MTTTPRDNEARLDVTDVSVRFGDVVAVDHVDLQVAAGEVVALLGPSGCGKSSLLGAVAGLVPHAGTVRLDGVDVTRHRTDQRDLGLMFQDGALFPHLDVGANIAFGLRMQGWGRADRADRVAEVLALVGLDGLASRHVHQLSGGQAQRVALGRAIAPQPRLLLLDEPLSSLDARLRRRLMDELPTVFAAVDAAVLHVTHDQDEAMAVADRIAVMSEGRIVRDAPPAALWDDPGSTFVAGFLGWTNIFPAAARLGDVPLVPASVRRSLGEPAFIGVDPGRVTVGGESAASSARVPAPTGPDGDVDGRALQGRVVSRRIASDHASVDVDLGHDAVIRAAGPAHRMPRTDERVTVTVDPAAWRALSSTDDAVRA